MAAPYVAPDPPASASDLPAQLQIAYRQFVETGLAHSDEGFRRVYEASPLAIGDDAFIREVKARHDALAKHAARPEDVAFRRRAPRLAAPQVLQTVAEHFGLAPEAMRQGRQETFARAAAAWMLRKHARMSYRRASGLLGWGSGVAASVQVRRLVALAAEDGDIAEELRRIEAKLGGGAKSFASELPTFDQRRPVM